MKNFLIKLALGFAFISVMACEKSAQPGTSVKDEMNTENAFKEFSIILSKAVCNEPELRSFLKEEALKQFDCDYDVFYPYVKHEFINGRETLGEILSKYDAKGIMPEIEKTVPKLTILVPDWSWVDKNCFSVNTWDTTNPLTFVAYDFADGSHQIVYDGEIGDVLPSGGFLDIPVLVIKSNERIKEDPEVKGGSLGFSFIDDCFDNSMNPETKVVYDREFEINLGSSGDKSDWISKMRINSAVSSCCSKVKNIPGAAQRDYIYYGMCEDKPSGYVNNKMYETIFRYKLDPESKYYFEEGDFPTYCRTDKKETNENMTNNQLKTFNWSEGKIEIRFTVNAGFATPNVAFDKPSFREAFDIVKAVENKHYNFFGAYTSHYYFIRQNCLDSKWIYPNKTLFTWDVATVPTSYTIQIHEVDDGVSKTDSKSADWQYSNNFTRNSEAGASIELLTLKTSFGISSSLTVGGSSTSSVTYTNNDDNLGSFAVQYINEIVAQESEGGVRLNYYDTDHIKVCIVPTLK